MRRKVAPGTCADCGSDAYIRLAGSNGSQEMVCAHCFADRVHQGKAEPREPDPSVPPPRAGPRH